MQVGIGTLTQVKPEISFIIGQKVLLHNLFILIKLKYYYWFTSTAIV